MNPPDIIEVALKVVRAFEKLGIDYHVGGSLASSAFGISRATLDVDVVADMKAQQAAAFVGHVKDEFYVDEETVHDAVRRRSSFNLIHLESMFKVDVFILKDRPYDRQAFDRRVPKCVSQDASTQLFFASPEDVILNKLEWFKAGGEVSDRQWNDVLGIIKVQGVQLDLLYLRKWAGILGLSNLLERAIKEAGSF